MIEISRGVRRIRPSIGVSSEEDLSQSVIVLLAHHQRAVARQHDIDGSIELGALWGTILLSGRAIAGDRGDFARRADDADAMIVAVGDVDGSVRGNDKPGRIVKAGV